jgi:hypothetical protein
MFRPEEGKILVERAKNGVEVCSIFGRSVDKAKIV